MAMEFSPAEIRAYAAAKKARLQANYQFLVLVPTLLAAVASGLLTPLGDANNYKRQSLSVSGLRDQLVAACYTSIMLSIGATFLTCYLYFRLDTLEDLEICRIWKHPNITVGRRPSLANYEIRFLFLIYCFCSVLVGLLLIGATLAYMYSELPKGWFYVWSTFFAVLFIIFLPILTLRLYRTLTGTDYT